MRKIDGGKKFNVEKTRYFDFHPLWLEQLIEKSFPELIRKKYEPPYKTLWPEVKLWTKKKKNRKRRGN